MPEEKKQPLLSGKEIATTAAATGAAVGQALTIGPAAATTTLAMAAAFVALFPPIIATLSEAGIRRMRARADRFYASIVENWATDDEMTAEEVAGILEAHKEDPNVADAIWRAVRALMDAPNDDAAVPLGVLAAEYARDKRPADAFFRGTTRLLTELSTAESRDLQRLVFWTLETAPDAQEVTLVAFDRDATAGPDANAWPVVPWRVLMFHSNTSLSAPDGILEELQEPVRLLSLLENTFLAFAGSLGWMGASPRQVSIRLEVVRRLAGVFRATE